MNAIATHIGVRKSEPAGLASGQPRFKARSSSERGEGVTVFMVAAGSGVDDEQVPCGGEEDRCVV